MHQGDPFPGVKIIVKRARGAFAFLGGLDDHQMHKRFVMLTAIECGWFCFHGFFSEGGKQGPGQPMPGCFSRQALGRYLSSSHLTYSNQRT